MSQTPQKQKNAQEMERPPVVVILGHVDHGKSSLLDYIRKTKIAEGEAGGITQHTYAYEITHTDGDGKERKITFLDTPGHEAFSLMRERGAQIADIAVLVVAANEGVKKQTLEALDIIQKRKLPFIVAVTKIDMPGMELERVKKQLAEHGCLVEGYGGDIPLVSLSSKTGEGIPELLVMILLVADLAELTGDPKEKAEGFIIESHRDAKRGISAMLVIKKGTIRKGAYLASSGSFSPLRRIENFLGKPIEEATFSSPVRVMGWDAIPSIGAPFVALDSKEEAMEYAQTHTEKTKESALSLLHGRSGEDEKKEAVVPVIIKADTEGTLEAILYEVKKMKPERVLWNIIDSSIGTISESDVKRAASDKEARDGALIVGFNVMIEERAKALAERLEIPLKTFDVIYRLTEWLAEEALRRRPKVKVEELVGKAKIIRVFSTTKHKHVVGGKVLEGKLVAGKTFRLVRRNVEIDMGKIVGLEQKKVKTHEVAAGVEFGALVETKHNPATGDVLESFVIVEK